ncbi:hypothetical protein Tco_0720448 [Tanacetum coccineum]
MEAGPSGSSGPTTRSKKRKNTGTNDDSQSSPSFLDAHDKWDLCPWVLINPDIPVKAVQDQLQRELEVQISMKYDNMLESNKTRVFRKLQKRSDRPRSLLHEGSFSRPSNWKRLDRNSNNGIFISIGVKLWLKQKERSRAKYDLLLNNIYEVFNGKIVGGRDKPLITLLEYIREYCIKRIVNVQGVIDKCTGPLTHTATQIMEFIKKKAHLMKVQWNKANKYQVSGRPRKKRKRSKHEDEPFVKDGKLSRKGRTITCQSCRNTRHNKATTKERLKRKQKADQVLVVVKRFGLLAAVKVVQVLPVKVHPILDGQREEYKQKELVHKKELPLNLQINLLPVLKAPVSEPRNADGREMGNGVPTQSS